MWNPYRTRIFFASTAVAALLSGCTETGQGTSVFGGGAGGLSGLDRSSTVKSQLSDDDRRGMSEATMQLLQSGQTNGTQNWRAGSDSGTVRIGSPVLVGLDSVSGSPVPAPDGIDTSMPLETASGNYLASKSINVRLGPSTNAAIAQAVGAGTVLRAFGKTGDWLLVGGQEQIYGYAFTQLLTAQGGGEPVLAGGRAHRARLCRNVALQVTLSGGTHDLWSALVCKKDDGSWEVPAERGLS
jgi:hypothetical protein